MSEESEVVVKVKFAEQNLEINAELGTTIAEVRRGRSRYLD